MWLERPLAEPQRTVHGPLVYVGLMRRAILSILSAVRKHVVLFEDCPGGFNYHQSRFHFVVNFFNQSSFHFVKKIIQLLFNPKNIFHQWNFYLSKELFSLV